LLFVGACEHHWLILCRWALNGDIGAQGVTQAGGEQLDLLGLDETMIAAGDHHEAAAVLVHGPSVPQHG
jgi:hypothetical protein